ncbi:TldD/PmbA family protein [Floridanema evergladense]|uniref:TldD/PmbA family protein n=1 Tax=Floridaenema evergladense BLCC-F167 TaxID=3153639 RepID=A0ABV4WHB0_9CYAN
MPSTQEIAGYAQEIAHKLGIKKFDICGSTVDKTSVEVYQGEPKQVNASSRSGVMVRVWNDKQTLGVTSTTDIDPLGIELALKTAYEASFFGAKENIPDFSPEATIPITHSSEQKAPQAPVDKLIETLLTAEKELISAHPAITSVPDNGLTQRDLDRFYVNSEGAVRNESHTISSIYLGTKTEQEGKKPRSAGAIRISRSLEKLDVQGCLQEAAKKTISHLDYQKVKTGKYQVVFSGEAFLSLLYAFSNIFNAQDILDKRSLATTETLGTKIASPLISLCDDTLHPSNVGATTFDDEGTPTRKTSLISNGVLTGLIHSAGTAKRLNAQPTGNANIGAKITVSPHFFHVFSEIKPDRELSIETADNVIYIDELKAFHAGVKAVQGSFSLPFDGWIIKNGELISIDAATVAGDFLQLLNSIIFVEKEAELTTSGVCPKVWVDALSITGE